MSPSLSLSFFFPPRAREALAAQLPGMSERAREHGVERRLRGTGVCVCVCVKTDTPSGAFLSIPPSIHPSPSIHPHSHPAARAPAPVAVFSLPPRACQTPVRVTGLWSCKNPATPFSLSLFSTFFQPPPPPGDSCGRNAPAASLHAHKDNTHTKRVCGRGGGGGDAVGSTKSTDLFSLEGVAARACARRAQGWIEGFRISFTRAQNNTTRPSIHPTTPLWDTRKRAGSLHVRTLSTPKSKRKTRKNTTLSHIIISSPAGGHGQKNENTNSFLQTPHLSARRRRASWTWTCTPAWTPGS
jgi:hypothetical protein